MFSWIRGQFAIRCYHFSRQYASQKVHATPVRLPQERATNCFHHVGRRSKRNSRNASANCFASSDPRQNVSFDIPVWHTFRYSFRRFYASFRYYIWHMFLAIFWAHLAFWLAHLLASYLLTICLAFFRVDVCVILKARSSTWTGKASQYITITKRYRNWRENCKEMSAEPVPTEK